MLLTVTVSSVTYVCKLWIDYWSKHTDVAEVKLKGVKRKHRKTDAYTFSSLFDFEHIMILKYLMCDSVSLTLRLNFIVFGVLWTVINIWCY